MAAAATDLLQKVGIQSATTLDANYTINDTTITVVSTSGWPSDTGITFAMDEIDSNGLQVAGTYNEFVGTVDTATSITNVDYADGTGDRNYTAGATTRVYIPVSKTRENRIVTWGTTQHKQDGTHADTITTDNINENTAAAGVTIDGLLIKDSKLAENDSVVTANITDDAVTPAKWTNPYCFRAWDSGGTTLTDGTYVQINLATENYDYNNNFTANAYTAPVAGVYHFSASVASSVLATPVRSIASIYKNGSAVLYGTTTVPPTTGAVNNVAGDLLLAANDVITLWFLQDTAGNETSSQDAALTFLSGHLVHAT